MNDSAAYLESADYESHPAFFNRETPIGAVISGEVVEPPRVVEVDGYDGGEREEKLVIAIANEADGETYAVWVGKNNLARAIVTAVKEATGAREIREGGRLSIKYDSNGTPKNPKHSPPKLYKAKYEPPKSSGVNPSDIFGDDDASDAEPF